LKEVYDKSKGLDGYVSLEVNPKLSDMADETVWEARRLFKKVNRPNVMFKIPATKAGYKAIEELTACGINVNATLIFSVAQYEKVANAYIRGLSRLSERELDLNTAHSVASVFVSRIDTYIDDILSKDKKTASLKGNAAVANSGLIFKKYLDIFSDEKFRQLEKKGANIQRVLWASTSTKNPAYSDIKYVTELIGKNTVNTLPESTFNAFLNHGIVEETLTGDITGAVKIIDSLKDEGIDVNSVCEKLLRDGIAAFEKSFDSLLTSIEAKVEDLSSKASRTAILGY
jgi:transaldolase